MLQQKQFMEEPSLLAPAWEAGFQACGLAAALARPVLRCARKRALREHFPGQSFQFFGMFINIKAFMRRNSRNTDILNLLLAVSKFHGGEVWRQDPEGNTWRDVQGTSTCGKLLDGGSYAQTLLALE